MCNKLKGSKKSYWCDRQGGDKLGKFRSTEKYL